MIVQHRHVHRHDGRPQDADDDVRVALVAVRHRADGVYDGQVAVDGHQHEGVDAGVGGDVQSVLVDLAEDAAERPHGDGVGDGGERHAHDDEEEIGDGQVDDEDVRSVAHQPVRQHDDDDEQVAEEAEHSDETEGDGNDDTDDGLEVAHPRDELAVRHAAVRLVATLGQRDTRVQRHRARIHHGRVLFSLGKSRNNASTLTSDEATCVDGRARRMCA